jgi:hypothetical protein
MLFFLELILLSATSFSPRRFFSKPHHELPLVAMVRQEKTASGFQKLSATIRAMTEVVVFYMKTSQNQKKHSSDDSHFYILKERL